MSPNGEAVAAQTTDGTAVFASASTGAGTALRAEAAGGLSAILATGTAAVQGFALQPGTYAGYFRGEGTNAVEVDNTGPGRAIHATASGTTIWAESTSGTNSSGKAIAGTAAAGIGVYGSSSTGYAGYFDGNVHVSGTLSKSAGSVRIDHPLDPANKYLQHSFVESPDMMNIYNGNVVLDEHGEAVVELPDWFEALNRDFRYQLTPLSGPMPNLWIGRKIKDNRFTISGGTPGGEVSWQVTGIRHDPWAEAHRIRVEEAKPAELRGTYLHPELYGQPRERGIAWARSPHSVDAKAPQTPAGR
ncbi:MAG TPA: hypothetical protein ENK19_03590 [Acidobacteria bacterium]|nr:hypothetical protein [Acidobacteriota bacterium]